MSLEELTTWATIAGVALSAFGAGLRKGRKGYLLPRARFYFSVRPHANEEREDHGEDRPQ